MRTAGDRPEPKTIAWCSWHSGLSDSARLVQTGEAGRLFACRGCRIKHGLTPIADQP